MMTHDPTTNVAAIGRLNEMVSAKEPGRHGISDKEYELLFTPDKPNIFAFHGYPWLIHRLTYRRPNHT
jgi:xylulose-5-phosphate/fructose-6-phosphate phosphoketolase